MKTGNQSPTFQIVGDYEYSLADEVIEMFEEDGGATFYPSQKSEMELLLSRNIDGSPAALTIGIAKPRQNGKSYSARYYAIYMADFEHRQVLYSAHHSTTTNKMFKAMCNLFENSERYPEFARDVKRISHVRGYEGIYFKDWVDEDGNIRDGGCIEFATRTNSGSRGGTYTVIIIDEAQELTTDQQEAILPTISAGSDLKDKSKMPQQIYIGTPPSPTCNGTVFAKMHEEAHAASKAGTVWWLEWAYVGDIEKIDSYEDAIEMAYQSNPAMGFRIAEKTVRNEYETMSPDGFARERLGWWTPNIVKQVDYAIDPKLWEACKSSKLKPEGKTAYGIRFSSDGAIVCVAGAVMDSKGNVRISLIDSKPTGYGLQWLADWLNQRYDKACCVVIDGKNNVDVLVDKISGTWKIKGSIIRPKTKDVIASVGMLTNAISEGTLTWYEKQEVLNESALNVTKRSIQGGWGFGGEYATPIEACALAVFGVKTSRRDPSKKMRIG